jgi:formamidopyrimidine-DNA glycosylase
MIKPFKNYFLAGRKIQDLQIEETIFEKYMQDGLLKEYRVKLSKLQLKEEKLFYSLIKDKTIKDLKNKYKTITFQIDNEEISEYMLNKGEK